jgi:nickel transport system substrate-binding protein
VLKESKLNQYDVLVRNDRYWGEKPQIEKITVKVIPDPTTRAVAFETGDMTCSTATKGCCRSTPSTASATTRPTVPSFPAR